MVVTTKDSKQKITLESNSFSSGGEGDVYKIVSPSSLKNCCVKILKDSYKTPEREQKLEFMISNPPNNVISPSVILAWPQHIVYDSGNRFLGFVMPLAFKNSIVLEMLTMPNIDYKRITNNISEWKNKFDRTQQHSQQNRLKLIYNLSYAINLLHSTNNYVLKDFKPPNVLVTPDGKITMVDMDSMQMCENGRLRYAAEVCTPGYTPPELHNSKIGLDKKIPLEPSWDRFSFAVAFYEILCGINPFQVTPKSNNVGATAQDKINNGFFAFGKNKRQIQVTPPPHSNFSKLNKDLQDLFMRAFDGPYQKRPTCIDWLKELSKELNIKTQQQTPTQPTIHAQTHIQTHSSLIQTGINYVYMNKKGKLKKTESCLKNSRGIYCGFVSVPSSAEIFISNSNGNELGPFQTPAISGCRFFVYDSTGRNAGMNGTYLLHGLKVIVNSSVKATMEYNGLLSNWRTMFKVDTDGSHVDINGSLQFYNKLSATQTVLSGGFTLLSDESVNFCFQDKGQGILQPLRKGKYELIISTKHTDKLTYSLIRSNSFYDNLCLVYENAPNVAIWFLAFIPIVGPIYFIISRVKLMVNYAGIDFYNFFCRLFGKKLKKYPSTTPAQGYRKGGIITATITTLIQILLAILAAIN